MIVNTLEYKVSQTYTNEYGYQRIHIRFGDYLEIYGGPSYYGMFQKDRCATLDKLVRAALDRQCLICLIRAVMDDGVLAGKDEIINGIRNLLRIHS